MDIVKGSFAGSEGFVGSRMAGPNTHLAGFISR